MWHTDTMKHVPDTFLWGASTAAHQVEGNTHNQWSEWEHRNAKRLAATAHKRLGHLPAWDRIARQATNPQNYISGTGVDHYNRYEEDFDIISELNMNAFRFGIEWSRIEPRQGEWDTAAIEHYKTYIAALKQRGITPVLTLWHWTMPTWFTDMGGFEKKANIAYFARYCAKIAELFAHDLTHVITLNEPNVYVGLSYGAGEWPPQRKVPLLMVTVYRNLVRAHKAAYQAFKQQNPAITVGIAAQLANTKPVNPRNILNKLTIRAKDYVANWWFLNRIKHSQDFIGLNYYFTEYIDWRGRIKNPQQPVSDLGWYMEPQSIHEIMLKTWKRYQKPIIVTENGLADALDSQRTWWIDQTLQSLETALAQGVDVRGYLHWSLLDNFEWAYGWWPEFGLVHVDRATQKRTIRQSAMHYAAAINQHKA